jgi:FG-GAP-like repeat/FG-GAP repeat
MSTFSTATNFLVSRNPNSVVVGDFNKDGKPDIATSNQFSQSISILLGNGTGSFGTATNFYVGPLPSSLVLGDFDSDGNQDIAVPYGQSAKVPNSFEVAILLGNGTGRFGPATSFYKESNGFSSVAVGDFNGDGKTDIAMTNDYFDNVSILLGTGTGSFGAATQFNTGTKTNPQSIVAGDFNADGKLDLATANY